MKCADPLDIALADLRRRGYIIEGRTETELRKNALRAYLEIAQESAGEAQRKHIDTERVQKSA